MTERSFGVLSGIEIAEAVERHKKYLQLREELAGADTFAHTDHRPHLMRCLEREPRIHIDNFDPTPSDEGGILNPNSVNLKLHPTLLTYQLRNGLDRLADGDATIQDHEHCVLDMKKDNPTDMHTIPEEGMVLKPGVLYLGRSMERLESYNLVPTLHGRSSTGRLGLGTHITAGYIDVGFCGTITLELTVIHPLRVYAGVAVCQVDFSTISPNHRPYRSKKYQGQVEPTASKLFMDFTNDTKEAT